MNAQEISITHSALGWVKKSIDDNLSEIKTDLKQYIEAGDADLLNSVKQRLGVIQGVLMMIEQYGAAMLTEEMLALADFIASGKQDKGDQALEVLLRAVLQLPDYLEHIQSGHRDIPIAILPLLNDIRAVRNQDLFSEKLLFLPDLSMHEEDAESEAVDAGQNQASRLLAKKLRAVYQLALVNVIREINVEESLKRLEKVCETLEERSVSEQVARIWWIVGALIESVSRQQLELGVSIKSLLGKVDALFRVILIIGERGLLKRQPIELIKNFLFYIAQPECDGPKAQAIKTAYRLEQFLPSESARSEVLDNIAGPNQALLKTVSEAMKAEIETVKSTLEVYVNGDLSQVSLLQDLPQEMHVISDTLAMIGLGAQRQLIEAQIEVVKRIVAGERVADEEQLLGMAAELLQVEQALEQMPKRQPPSQQPKTESDVSRDYELDSVLGAVVTAALDDIQKTKNAILEVVKDPGRKDNIELSINLMQESRGALVLLEKQPAVDLIDGLVAFLKACDAEDFADAERLDALSQVVVSLEYYLEALGEHRGDADTILEMAGSQLQQLLAGVEQRQASKPSVEAAASLPGEPVEAVVAAAPAPDSAAGGVEPGRADVEADDEATVDSYELLVEIEEPVVEAPAAQEVVEKTQVMPAAESAADAPVGEDGFADTQVLADPQPTPDAAEEKPVQDDRAGRASDADDDPFEATQVVAPVPGSGAATPADATVVVAPLADQQRLLEQVAAARTAGSNIASIEDDLEVLKPGSDPEILEIYLEEARDESANIARLQNDWRLHPEDENAVKNLRRAFHTIKGSGRLVGALKIGEFAWDFEQLLNRVIDKTVTPNPQVIEAVGHAARVLPELVEELKTSRRPQSNIDELRGLARSLAEFKTEELLIDHTQTLSAIESPYDHITDVEPEESEANDYSFGETTQVISSGIPADAIESGSAEVQQRPVSPASPASPAGKDAGVSASYDDTLLSEPPRLPADDARHPAPAGDLADPDDSSLATGSSYRPAADYSQPRATPADTDAGEITDSGVDESSSQGNPEIQIESVGDDFIGQGMLQDDEFDASLTLSAADDSDPVEAVFSASPRPDVPAAPADSATAAHAVEAPSLTDSKAHETELTPPEEPGAEEIELTSPEDSGAEEIELTSPAEPGAEEIELTSPAEPGAEEIELTSPAEPGAEEIELTSPEELDAEEIEFTSPEDSDAEEIELTSPAEPGAEEIELTSPEELDAEEIEFTSPVDSDAEEIELTSPAESGAEEIEFTSPAEPEAEEPVMQTDSFNLRELDFEPLESRDEPVASAADTQGAKWQGEVSEADLQSLRENPPGPLVATGGSPVPGDAAEVSAAKDQEAGEPTGLSFDPELLTIYQQEVEQHLDIVNSALDRADSVGELIPGEEIYRALHTIHGASRTADITSIGELAGLLEKPLKAAISQNMALDNEIVALYREGHRALHEMTAELVATRKMPAIPADLKISLSALADDFEEHTVDLSEDESGQAGKFVDTLTMMNESADSDHDSELLEIFVDEANELLEMSDNTLHHWSQLSQNDSDNQDYAAVMELQRYLHTLKGGARMAELKEISDLSHEMESLFIAVIDGRVEKTDDLIELLKKSFDLLHRQVSEAQLDGELSSSEGAVEALRELRLGESGPSSADMTDDLPGYAMDSEDIDIVSENLPGEPLSGIDRSTQDVIKVRADLLDNLVSSAGEVSIYRARMEQQVAGLGSHLGELGQTITRLKSQLRSLEAETDAQIHFSHRSESHQAGEFDPLEMDRYTMIQELSRSLSESVNDLSSLQNMLGDQVKDSETLLLQQSRVSSDLQDGLIKSRMVKFSGLLSRLRRLVRQSSQELGKKAELVVTGEQNEVDNKVLDRMVAPLEHIIRNALSHGIETPVERVKKGKPEMGRIAIDITRDGSDVVIKVSDDGAGVNIEKVRSRAIQLGLLEKGHTASDADLVQLILEPGFSTAEHVTQLSGRGVGMDVVDIEVKQLGGTLSIETTPQGTVFVARLPFTLSINQAILVRCGEETYAIPLLNIEGITRLDAQQLHAYYRQETPEIEYAGQNFMLRNLAKLVGADSPFRAGVNSEKQVVILSRAGDVRIALHVDEIIGNREIVVKSLGKQLSQVKSLSGASILADGSVVLILDVAGLVRHQAGSVVKVVYSPSDEKQGRQRSTVMVVDDSITMRRIASKLLQRHNYEVVTAKDGVDALAQLADVHPDVMLLDIEMPRMDGFELATHMRNEASYSEIPIIMITSRTGEKHRDRALEIGVANYMGKPYQEQELVENIQSALAGR